MPEEIGLFEAIYTQRAIRYLKPEPVPNELIRQLIDAATQAPSAVDRQPWRFIVIRDAETKRRIGEYYRLTFEAVYGSRASAPRAIPSRMRAGGAHLAEHIHEAPVLILACIAHDGSASTMQRGASIYPAIQNLLLAARGLGLGAVLTDNHKRYEREVKELIGIPDNVETAAIIPIGYPAEEARYGRKSRVPADEFTYWEHWNSRDEG